MKKIIIMGLALAFTLVGVAQNAVQQNAIEVTGKSVIEIVPDEIYLKIIIDEADTKEKISLEQFEEKMIKKLKSLAINIDEQLMVDGMESDFYKAILKKQKTETSKSYQLIVNSSAQMADVYIALEKVGISNISVYKVDHSKLDEYKLEANVQATKNAKNRAQAIAAAIDQEIGSATYIRENEIYMPQVKQNRMYSRMEDASYKSSAVNTQPDLQFEKLIINGSVFVRFDLLPKQ